LKLSVKPRREILSSRKGRGFRFLANFVAPAKNLCEARCTVAKLKQQLGLSLLDTVGEQSRDS